MAFHKSALFASTVHAKLDADAVADVYAIHVVNPPPTIAP
jgi:hypothetical protein